MSHVIPTGLNKTQQDTEKTTFGFWVYLMTDCVLFASLFATYAVLRNNTFGGEPATELFSLPFVLFETIVLLASSFTCGLAVLAARSRRTPSVIRWLVATAVLGLLFLSLELYEFYHLVHDGNSWQRSGFLSAFFTLVGTHGLHIAAGLIWVTVLIARIARYGLTHSNLKKIALFSLFWHFLDIIWIFIFTFVYLAGGI